MAAGRKQRLGQIRLGLMRARVRLAGAVLQACGAGVMIATDPLIGSFLLMP
jgi:hypothetical protein